MGVLKAGKTAIKISAESEEEDVAQTVASFPVQSGNAITDHTQQESQTWSFEGKIYGKNQTEVDKKFQQLLNWAHAGTLLRYYGAIHHGNMMITNLHKTYDEGGFTNAIKFTMELRYVAVVKTSFTKAKHVGPKKPKPAKKPGVYVTVRRGNTYWGWWVKYGTSIQTLRNWNHWPDRRIPIGARARVK